MKNFTTLCMAVAMLVFATSMSYAQELQLMPQPPQPQVTQPMQSVLTEVYGQPQVQTNAGPIFPRLTTALQNTRRTARTCVDGVCSRAASGVQNMRNNATTRVKAFQGRRAVIRSVRSR